MTNGLGPQVCFLVRSFNRMSLNVTHYLTKKHLIVVNVLITSMYAILIQNVRLMRGYLWK